MLYCFTAQDTERVRRLEVMKENGQAKIDEKANQPMKDVNAIKRLAINVPHDPIIIGTSEDVGTARCRANHVSAQIDYCEEQEFLKKMKFKIV